MKTIRDKFEELPEIKLHLSHGNVFWSEKNNAYASEFKSLHVAACYVNGAWYAFQEQQKKIDLIKKHIESFYSESDLWGSDSDQALRQIELIQELLK